MSIFSQVYRLYELQFGDTLYPDLDQRNMQIIENQLAELMAFVGQGVLTGWDVTWMSVSQNFPLSPQINSPLYQTTLSAQKALTKAYLNQSVNPTDLGMQFLSMFPPLTTTGVDAVATTNVAVGSSTIDGVLLTQATSTSDGSYVLLTNQNIASQNGLYILQWVSGSSQWVQQFNSNYVPSDSSSSSGSSNISISPYVSFVARFGETNALTVWAAAENNQYFDAWIQCIAVSPGEGIVGVYAAHTNIPAYFRFTSPNVYYTWAQSSLCLATEGNAIIVAPQDPSAIYDQYNTATYLAEVAVAQESTVYPGIGIYYVNSITYGNRRNELLDLAGALQQALNLYFYHHVHLGPPDHPTKIDLSTDLTLIAQITGSSPIFYLYTEGVALQGLTVTSGGSGYTSIPNVLFTGGGGFGASAIANIANGAVTSLTLTSYGNDYTTAPTVTIVGGGGAGAQATATLGGNNVFTWTQAVLQPLSAASSSTLSVGGYGLPSVYLNDNLLPPSTYNLIPSAGKIFLKNNLLPSDRLEVVLPLSPQVSLTMINTSSITDATIYLTDGVNTYDSDGNILGERLFSWDNGYYASPQVYLNGNLITSGYTIDSNSGSITFNPSLSSNSGPLTVVLTYIGIQIQNFLPGKRLTNVDASTFTKGIIDQTRITGLDHVGQVRALNPCVLRPTLRLLSDGDHLTYYPEVLNTDGTSSLLQFNTDVFMMCTSANVGGVLLGTKRGLLITTDYIHATQLPSWPTDMGEPIFAMDNILLADTYTNYFHTTYILTATGMLYSTQDGGSSFQSVKLPTTIDGTPIPGTCFWVSTDRIDTDATTPNGGYVYTSILYLGTSEGLYSVTISDGATQDQWEWGLASNFDASNNFLYGNVISVVEMMTLNYTSSDTAGVKTAFDRTLYVSSSNGFYVGGSCVQLEADAILNPNIVDILWLTQGNAANDLLLVTDTKVRISHTAELVVINGTDSYSSHWIHPLTQLPFSGGNTVTTLYGGVGNGSDQRHLVVQVDALPSNTYNATTKEYTIAPLIVDGYELQLNDMVLLVNGTVPGVYVISNVASGISTTWSLDGTYYDAWNSGSLSQVANIWFIATGGNYWSDSAWSISLPQGTSPTGSNVYTTDITWICQWNCPVTTDISDTFSSAYNVPNTLQYVVLSESGPIEISDGLVTLNDPTNNPSPPVLWPPPTVTYCAWDQSNQMSPLCMLINSGSYIIGSARGLWTTNNLSTPSSRAIQLFTVATQPTLYDEFTGSVIDGSTWVNYPDFQSYVFNAVQPIWKSFLYEQLYQTYWCEPWNPLNAQVALFLALQNQQPVAVGDPKAPLQNIQYATNPLTGEITFLSSLNPSINVFITIVRPGAYISDIGATPHLELPGTFLINPTPATTLIAAYPPTSGDNVLQVSNPQSIPLGTNYVQLQNSTGTWQLPISIDPSTYVISVLTPYTGLITFGVNSRVYIVTVGPAFGIEDYLTLFQTNQTYNLNSVAEANTAQLTTVMRKYFYDLNITSSSSGSSNPDSLFNSFHITTEDDLFTARLGPVNALLFDFSIDDLDDIASYATLSISCEPNQNDSASNPIAVYAIAGDSTGAIISSGTPSNGDGIIVGTDQGIWSYSASSGRWTKESDLNGATRVYFIQSYTNGTFIAGTDQGVFVRDTSNTWNQLSIYPEATFAHLMSSWDSDSEESFGKSNGLVFIYPDDTTTFESDHFDPIDNIRVNGLYHAQFKRVSGGDASNTTMVDALYCSTDAGLYGVCDGNRGGTDSSLLNGREMFGAKPLMQTITLPSGGTESVPIKIYSVFQSKNTTPTPGNFLFYICTNNGLYRVRNWRWTDPIDPTTPDFAVEAQFMDGRSCFCNATDVAGSVYKMFVGTDQGLYRSTNDGLSSFEACERFNGMILPVYDIKVIGSNTYTFTNSQTSYVASQLLAATSDGLWYSPDEGDTWYRPNPTLTPGGNFYGNITSSEPFNGSVLAQTFSPPPEAGSITSSGLGPQIVQVMAYLETEIPSSGYNPSTPNTLTAMIFNTTPSGIPVGSPLLTSSTNILSSDVQYPQFYSWKFNATPLYVPSSSTTYSTTHFAIVVKETLGGSNTEYVFRWHKSNHIDAYSGGAAYSGDNSYTTFSPIGTTQNPEDLFFRVIFEAPSVPIETEVNVGQLPTADVDNPGFLSGDSRGTVVNNSGYLTTDFKIVASLVIDDSNSITWADPGETVQQEGASSSSGSAPLIDTTRLTYLQKLIDRLWNRTSQSANWDSNSPHGRYYASYMDVWEFGQTEIEKTQGFQNNVNLLDLVANALFAQGESSSLYDCTNIAMSELQPSALVGAVVSGVNANDTTLNNDASISSMTTLINYLQQNNLNRLNDVVAYWTNLPEPKSGWDQTWASIPLYNDVSTFVAQQWANSFVPVGFVVSDGDDDNSGTPSQIAETVINAWKDQGVPFYVFGLGRSHYESNIRSMTAPSKGKHIDITIADFVNADAGTTDWDAAINSFLHGGDNTLFTANWSQSFDWESPKFVKSIHTAFTTPGTSSCVVQIQFTVDRLNWTPWLTVPNDNVSGVDGLLLNTFIVGLNYRIVMRDGWSGSDLGGTIYKPTVTSLYHITITPATTFQLTQAQPINGQLFEYILSASANVPPTAQLTWGIIRGDTTNINDFEAIRNNRRGCLPNREQSIAYTPTISQLGLSTTTHDYITYTAIASNGQTARWSTTDVVTLFADTGNGPIQVNNSSGVYGTDGTNGTITFFAQGGSAVQPAQITYTVNVVTPSAMYISNGEATTTIDAKTYYASNGSWPQDAIVIVLVNGDIKRGGYYLNPAEGTITFWTQRQNTDIVSVFIQPAPYYRVGVLINNYDAAAPVTLKNFGLYYSTLSNTGLLTQYLTTAEPSITSALINPPNPMIANRLSLAYTFYSPDGNQDQGAQTAWFVLPANTSSSSSGGSGGSLPPTWVPIDGTNGTPNYTNRTIERLADTGNTSTNASNPFAPGNQIKVALYANDGFNINPMAFFTSPTQPLLNYYTPTVNGLSITGTGVASIMDPTNTYVVGYTAPAGNALTTVYNLVSQNPGAIDKSIVTWYIKDAPSTAVPSTTAPTAPIIASDVTKRNDVWSFSITPADQYATGTQIQSISITIV